MSKKLGNICIILGTALLLAALGLFLRNRQEAEAARKISGEHLAQLVQTLESPGEDGEISEEDWLSQQVLPMIPKECLTAEDLKMTETVIDGLAYIGYLSMPTLELELTVLADWDYPKLKVAPCRYYGTVRGEDLVLMAHNYRSHFGPIANLQEGDPIFFRDMDGLVTHYQVVGKDVLPPDAVEEMTAGEFALTLFTCTYGGENRVTVYCSRVF